MSIFVDQIEKNRRMTICYNCEHIKLPSQICGICFCFLPAKTKLTKSRCPRGKWAVNQNQDEQKST